MAAVDFNTLLRQGLAFEGREPRDRGAPDQDGGLALPQGGGFIQFESELKSYQSAVKHLTCSNLVDVLPKFEGANLNLEKLRRLGELTHRESSRLRIKFRGDLGFYKRLDIFHKKLQGSWKGRLVELFCKVLDVEKDNKFRRPGLLPGPTLDELFAAWSANWSQRLASSKGKALKDIEHAFERAQRQAAKEATELNALEVAFDEQVGGPAQAPRSGKRRRRGDLRESPVGARAPSQRPAPSARPAPSSAVGAQAPPRRADPRRAPRTPPGADEAAPST